MNNITLKNLLIEYDKKRIQAEEIARREKEKLYNEFPELDEIDRKLSFLALSSMKELIKNNDKEILNKLNSDIEFYKNKKETILNRIGEKRKKIYPLYECNRCNDTGYIFNESISEMCNCLKQKLFDVEYNKSNMNNLDKQNFSNFNINYYSNKIDKERYNSDISPRENIKLIQSICENFIKNFDNPEEKNLLFTGKTGLGKTFLSGCVANELLKKEKTVLYQTASTMLDTIIGYRFNKGNISANTYEHFLNVDLLIIDDLGTEGINNMKLVELFNLLNNRLLNKKATKTIISTNLSLKELFATYDERIVSRIVGNYNICYFFGEDIRFVKN